MAAQPVISTRSFDTIDRDSANQKSALLSMLFCPVTLKRYCIRDWMVTMSMPSKNPHTMKSVYLDAIRPTLDYVP